jgi:diguanylate cyclase (GGDEF)-like protein/PAS domain S-box-containing protein
MGISKKTLIIVSIIFSIILIALFFYLRFSVLENYLKIEEEATVDKVMQVKKILNKNLDQVKRISSSFSLSRQTYDYINDRNDSFIETDLTDKLLAELGIDIFILADGNNDLKYAMFFDRAAMKKTPAPAHVTDIFSDEKFLKTADNFLIERSGIMMIDSTAYFIVIKPVKPADSSDNKSAGTIIIGQMLSGEVISAISSEIKNEVSITDINNPEVKNSNDSIISNLSAGADYDISYISSKEIEGHTFLKDLNGKPVLLLSVKSPRTVYAEGRNNIYTLFFVIFFVGIISSLTIFFVIEKIVLSRIVSLSKKTEEIGKTKDLSKNVSFSGRDEVAKLAVSINKMLRDLKINELDILKSEKRFKDLVELLPEIVIETDCKMNISFANQSFFKALGYDKVDLDLGLSLKDILVQADFKKVKDSLGTLSQAGKTYSAEYTLLKKSGNTMTVLLSSVAIFTDNSDPAGFRSLIVDITDKKKEEEKLRELEERWQFALEGSGDGVWDWNFQTNAVFYSKKLKEILGYGEEEFRNNLSEVMDRIHKSDYPQVIENINRHLRDETPFYTAEYRIRKKDGTYMWALDRGKIVRRDEEGKPVRMIGTLTDMTVRKKLEEEIKRLAYSDPLTNLPNRLVFNDRIELIMASSKRYNRKFAVMIVDIDKFKKINDTLGHSAGDELIYYVGKTIQKQLRKSDTIARFGGDEFLLLLPDIKNRDDAKIIVSKIMKTFKEKIDIDGKKLAVTLSIGISVFPEDGQDVSTLLKNADLALYDVKAGGRNNYKFYSGRHSEEKFLK